MPVRCSGLFMMCVLAGCAGPTAAGRGGTALLQVQVQTVAGDGQVRAVAPGEVMHSGDRFSIRVDAGRETYVQVVHTAGDKTEVVWPVPPAAAPKLAEGAPLYLPEAGKWFAVDEGRGEEALVIVASAQPLPPERLLEEARRPPAPAGDKEREPPPEASEKNRGGSELRTRLSTTGATVLRFSFRHE